MNKQEERIKKHSIILGIVLAFLAAVAYLAVIVAVYMLK